jgi:peptide/nickel transport system substrate-binding protein
MLAIAMAGLSPSAGVAQGPGTKVLRIPFPKYDGTLTPYTFKLGYPLVTLVYDTLLWRDSDGTPRPWLAQSVTRSNGGMRVTVRLRKGVRWQDGRPLTAEDVAFTFRFVADRSPQTPELADLERVQARDPETVTFDLRRPSLGFDQQPLADLPILPRHLWQGLSTDQLAPRGLPVGSGPYRLLRANRGTGYVFSAYAGYFRGRPQVERLEVPIIHQDQATYTALKERRVDMLPFTLPRDSADDLSADPGISLRTGPLYAGTALLLNVRRAPFNRLEARRAVAASLDLGRIVRNVAPAVSADRGYIHPASRWASTTPLQRFDPRAAKTDFAALKLQPIRVLASVNDPVRLEAGRQVVLALARAGVSATLGGVSRARLGRATGEGGGAPAFDAAIVSTPALTSYDPDFLSAIFGSDRQAALLNYSGYRSAAFDALARRVANAPDEQARRAAVESELRLLAGDVPSIPLFFPQGTFAIRPAIYDGWIFVAGTGIFDKRSFLPGPTANRNRSGADHDATPAGSGSSALDVLGTVSLVVLAIAVVLATVAGVMVLRRRSAGRR